MLRSIVIKLLVVVLLLGGFAAAQINLGPNGQIQVKGTTQVANGGTSFGSYTAGDFLCASGTTTLQKLAIGATNGFTLQIDNTQPCKMKWAASITGAGGADTEVQANCSGAFCGYPWFKVDTTNQLVKYGNGSSQGIVGFKGFAGTPTIVGSDATYCWGYFNTTTGKWEGVLGDNSGSCTPGAATVSVNVNGSSVSSPNFNDSTPAAPANSANVAWQHSGSSVSAYIGAAGASLGLTKSGACSAGNHADGTYNADGTPHCSADTGGGGSGALVLLGTYTASAVTELNVLTRNAGSFTGAIFQSDYTHYKIDFDGIVPGTTSSDFKFSVTSDGGSTWDTTAGNYKSACLVLGGSCGTYNSTQIAGISTSRVSTGHTLRGSMDIHDPTNTDAQTMQGYYQYFDTALAGWQIGGRGVWSHANGSAINGIRFDFGGTVTITGTVYVYAYSH